MSVGFSQQSAIWHFLIVVVLTLTVWVPGGDARAARVSGLYGAVVELQKGANEPSRDNFNEASGRFLWS